MLPTSMSLVEQILQSAAAKQRELLDEHAQNIKATCEEVAESIRRPWKSRVESIGEASALVKQIAAAAETPAQQEDPKP
jgi:hypothetical protein